MKIKLNLSDYILPFPFFIALFIGLMMVYILTPEPQVVFKHPNPNNVDSTIYQNDVDDCYKYEVKEVKCPSDKSKIKDTPINKD